MAEVHALARDLGSLHAVEPPPRRRHSAWRQAWSAVWPRAGAVLLILTAWQLVAASGWKPAYLLPEPRLVMTHLARDGHDSSLYLALGTTLSRAVVGVALAAALGTLGGALVARIRPLRAATGSLITGLQSMPSIAWFPLAILLFGTNEAAITFVVVMGAAPAIANGLISGIDHIPPLLIRYGRVAGPRGLSLYRHVILPAALPAFTAGLKQGWAFAWRSLMAGELLVVLSGRPSLGARLQFARQRSDAEGLLAAMVVVLLVGVAVDTLFGVAQRTIRRRWGLES